MYHGEKFNSISHLIGAALAIAGASILVTLAIVKGDIWRIVGFSIYGAMMIFLYSTSAIYHSIQGPWKKFFQKMDHFSIYLMIAGSYTPFTIILLGGTWGWTIFGVVWGLAFLGILQEILIGHRTRRLSMLIYFLMGWLIIVAFQTLIRFLPPWGLTLLVGGGLFYTVGIIFYVFDDKLKHSHGIWHLFVLAGSISQFLCVLLYLA